MIRRVLIALAPLAFSFVLQTAAPPGHASAADERRISITGTVDSVGADRFTLKDLGRRITVEMAGDPWHGKDVLAVGDRVAVIGETVGDFAESRRIRASALAIPKLNYPGAPDDDWLALSGIIAAITGDSLALDCGGRSIAIDASGLAGGLSGLGGGPAFRVGDRVTVAGAIPDAFLGRRQGLRASSIALLPADAR